MAQNTVFGQLIKLIPRSHFQSWVTKHDTDKRVRSMDSWTWFGALLFGQMSGHDSIRAIERVFAHQDKSFKDLGFGSVRRSTLADANGNRSIKILEEIFFYSFSQAKKFAPKAAQFYGQNVLAMDATLIELCLSLSPWAEFHSGENAMVKIHTAIDVADNLPEFAVITSGKIHDRVVAKTINFKPGATLVVDRNYVEYEWLSALNKQGVFWVTRPHLRAQFKVVKCRKTDRTRGYLCDQIVRFSSWKGKRYEGYARRISYRCPDTKKKLIFITNRMDLDTQTICDLYKARWKVELFFKCLKQNLKIKKFLGRSQNAVKAQILVALIAYLLVQIWRFTLKMKISMPDAMAVVGTLLLFKQALSRLFGELPNTKRHPPPEQFTFAF